MCSWASSFPGTRPSNEYATRRTAQRVLAAARMTNNLLRSAIALFILGTHVVHAEPNARTAKPVPPSGKAQAKPTVVLVHGAWADGSSWDKVTPLLQGKGYNVIAVHLPMTS